MKHRTPVTERALLQRINRHLRKQDHSLKKVRGERAWIDLGDFYLLDWQRNAIVQHHIDIEQKARELKVLAKWEVLKGDRQ